MQQFIDQSTSAWFKTVIDPAHNRDYGSAGIPDENKMPTLVLSDRYTVALELSSFSGKWQEDSGNEYTDGVPAVIERVSIMGLPTDAAYLVIVTGSFTRVSEPNTTRHGYRATYFTTGFYDASQKQANPRRQVAYSFTADTIGATMYNGGYFEAGYFPSRRNVSNGHYVVNAAELTTYATRTCNYRDGVYAVARMSSYDWARVWRTGYTSLDINVTADAASASSFTIKVPIFNDCASPTSFPNCGYDLPFVSYYPSGTSSWVLRLTSNYITETQASYTEGGTDGAVFDRAAVDAYMAICDQVPGMYPSSYNDLQKVLSFIKRAAGAWNNSAVRTVLSATGARNVTMAIDALAGFLGQADRRHAKQLIRGTAALQPLPANKTIIAGTKLSNNTPARGAGRGRGRRRNRRNAARAVNTVLNNIK